MENKVWCERHERWERDLDPFITPSLIIAGIVLAILGVILSISARLT